MRSLLKDHLDLARFAKRDDVSDEQFQFLVTATPQDVRDLVATEGYFTPVVRTDVKVVDNKKTVTVSVDPGPQTTVASVSLTFKGAVTTEDPKQENTARFAFSVQEGDAFSQDAWSDAKNAALKALQARRYLGAKITRSQARVNPRTHIADLSVTFDSGPTFTFGDLDVSGVRRYPEAIIHNVNPIHPGDIYDIARVNELQRQLQNTPYYASVAIDADNDVTKPDNTPIHLKVSEYPYNSVRYGVGYATDTGPHIQGAYSYLDTFGKAYPFTISGRLDQTQQYGQVQLAMPPGARGWVNSVLASYTNTNVSDTRIYSARVGVQRSRSTQNIDTTYALMFYDDRLTQNAPNPSSARALMPSWQWIRRNVDDPLFPRSGNLVRAEAGFAIKNIATEQTFARLYTNLLQYLPITKRDLFVFRAEFGGVFTSGPSNGIPASLLVSRGRRELGARLQLPEHRQQRRRIDPADQVSRHRQHRVSALVHARLGRRGILRHRYRHRYLEGARLPAGRRHRGALAQSGRAGERRCGLWFQEQEHQAVSDARHRLLIFLRKPRHA